VAIKTLSVAQLICLDQKIMQFPMESFRSSANTNSMLMYP